MVKSLVVFGWLRDFVLILLLLAGSYVRHTSPIVGTIIIMGAGVVLAERFLWSWYLCDLKDLNKE
jgi:hypothetical protein